MSIESDARKTLGLLLRKFREERGLNRCKLAKRVKLNRKVIVSLEHGVVNPSRRDFESVKKVLGLSPKERGEAFRLLNIFHSRRWRKRKSDQHICHLRHCNRNRR
jgi:ribosome-binding protein aMBF1 (putative translation factor)